MYSRSSPLKTFIGYVCAVGFAWIAADLTLRSHSLRGTPVALNFGVVVAITMFFGIGPGIVSVLSTAIVFYFRFMLPGSSSPFALGSVVRVALIVGIGILLAYLSQRQRTIGLQLRSALASLREHADTLAQAQQGSRSAAWVFHPDDGSLQRAQGGAELLGHPFDGIDRLGLLIDLACVDDRSAIERAVEQTLRTETLFHAEFRAVLPNGDTRWLEMRGAPSPPDQMQWRGVVLDVTERKNAESALIRSEKLAAIGRLSATVAHEINNPLEAVTNLLYLASSDPALPSEARMYLQDADRELQRLASIARHTLTYARTKFDEGPTDVAPVAESVVAMFRTRRNSRGGEVRVSATHREFFHRGSCKQTHLVSARGSRASFKENQESTLRRQLSVCKMTRRALIRGRLLNMVYDNGFRMNF